MFKITFLSVLAVSVSIQVIAVIVLFYIGFGKQGNELETKICEMIDKRDPWLTFIGYLCFPTLLAFSILSRKQTERDKYIEIENIKRRANVICDNNCRRCRVRDRCYVSSCIDAIKNYKN